VHSPRNTAEGFSRPVENGARKRKRVSCRTSYAFEHDCAHLAWLYERRGCGGLRFELESRNPPRHCKLPGYRGTFLLRRRCGNEVEFTTVMLWDSLEAVCEFAGPNYEQAIVPVERRRLFSHFDERSAHYEILMQPAARDACSDV